MRTSRYFALVWILLATILAFCVDGLFRDFISRGQSDADKQSIPRTAIVFTGQFDRIRFALGLMEEGVFDRLFISGVNPAAGIVPTSFAAQFSLSPRLISAMAAGDIVLATDANTTIENAIETSCWLSLHPNNSTVALITSQKYMARASLALERALPARRNIIRMMPDQTGQSHLLPEPVGEFLKFSATWLITLMPKFAWTAKSLRSCTAAYAPFPKRS